MSQEFKRYRRQAHAVFDCRYHIVFVTKYRFRVIGEKMEIALKWIIKEICDWKGIEILEGSVNEEHIHLYLRIPPKYSISDAMKWIKGKSAERMMDKFPELEKRYWGGHLWARGYFVSTVGITDQTIREYIQHQRDQEVKEFNDKWH